MNKISELNTHQNNIWKNLELLPRLTLLQESTPIQLLSKLSDKLGCEIWCKRDDLISFGYGGNKIRGLEILAADALNKQCDVFVTGAGVQSNHVRATVMVACYLGLRSRVVFWGEQPATIDGNYRITNMLGAEVVFTGDSERSSVDGGIDEQCTKLLQQGYRPYQIPRGGACALGAIGHVLAAKELYLQCREQNIRPKTIVLATGSGGTHAGWLLGSRILGDPWTIQSYTVSRGALDVRREIVRLANEAATLLELDVVFNLDEVIVHDGFIGDGYGIPSDEAAVAIKLLAHQEGILLDPTYTGKAMAGLLHSIDIEADRNSPFMFIHTGGEPAFFAGDGQWLDSIHHQET